MATQAGPRAGHSWIRGPATPTGAQLRSGPEAPRPRTVIDRAGGQIVAEFSNVDKSRSVPWLRDRRSGGPVFQYFLLTPLQLGDLLFDASRLRYPVWAGHVG